jgi:hypothetical protein
MIGFLKLRWRVFIARYALSLILDRMRFVFKGLRIIPRKKSGLGNWLFGHLEFWDKLAGQSVFHEIWHVN